MLPCERVHVRDREKENVLTFFANFIIKWHMTFFFFVKKPIIKENYILNILGRHFVKT